MGFPDLFKPVRSAHYLPTRLTPQTDSLSLKQLNKPGLLSRGLLLLNFIVVCFL
jgi:hypothetical protein